MTTIYVVLGIVVSGMAVCGGLFRFARSIVRIARACLQLATAVRDNTAATDALAVEMRTYRTATDHRLDQLEGRRHGPRAHP